MVKVMELCEINDLFRLSRSYYHEDPKVIERVLRFMETGYKGRAVFAGALVRASRAKQIAALYGATRPEIEFTEENDPYGEHDFGAVIMPGTREYEEFRIFWKIDYYSDSGCECGAENPLAESSYRLLTIMFPEDY